MAGQDIKKLLVKLGISTTDWKTAVKDIRNSLGDIQKDAKRNVADAKAAAQEELRTNKLKIADEQRLQAEARTMSEIDKARIVFQKQLQAAAQTRLKQVQLETAEIRQQITLEREKERAAAKAARAAATSSGGGGGGFLNGILGGIARGAGGGLAGSVFAGAFAGGGIALLTEKAAEGVEHLTQKIREFIEAGGQIQQVREQFAKLTARQGDDPAKYLEDMRKATKGLVGDLDLYRVANNFMQRDQKATEKQVVDLTTYTVGLARAQGKDAPEAMQRLVRASLTGRTAMLAMVTGISRYDLQLHNLPKNIDSATRAHMEFEHTLEVLEKRYRAVGEPQLTFVERTKQMRVATDHLFEGLAEGISTSGGMKQLMDYMSDLADKLNSNENLFKTIGDNIGSGFGVVAEVIKTVGTAFDIVSAAASSLKSVFDDMLSSFGQGASGDPNHPTWGDVFKQLSTVKGAFQLLGVVVIDVKYAVLELGAAIQLVGAKLNNYADKTADFLTTGKSGAFVAAMAPGLYAAGLGMKQLNKGSKKISMTEDTAGGFLATLDAERKAEEDKFMKGQNAPGYKPGTANKEGATPGGNAAAQAQKMAALKVQLAKAVAKEQIDIATERVKSEQDLVDQEYKHHEITIDQYIEKRKNQEKELLQIKLHEIAGEAAAEQNKLDVSLRNSGMTKGEYDIASKLLQIQTNEKVQAANNKYTDSARKLDDQQDDDVASAAQRRADIEIKTKESSLKEIEKLVEDSLKNNEISYAQYRALREQQIGAEMNLEIQAARQKYAANKDSLTAQAELYAAEKQAQEKAEVALTELTRQENAKRLSVIESRYSHITGILQGQLTLAQGDNGQKYGGATAAIGSLSALKDLSESKIRDLQTEMDKLEKSGAKFSDDWLNVKDAILKAEQEQEKYNAELRKAKDFLTPLGGAFDELANVVDNFSKNLGDAFKLAGQALAAGGKLMQQGGFAGIASSFKDLFRKTSAPQDPAIKAQNDLTAATTQSAQKTQDLSTKIQQLSTPTQNLTLDFQKASTAVQQFADRLANFVPGKSGSGSQGAGLLGFLSPGGPVSSPLGAGVTGNDSTGFGIGSNVGSLEGLLGGGATSSDGGSGGGLIGKFKNLFKVTDQGSTKMATFAGKLQAGIGAVGGFVSSMTSPMGGAAGALSGGMSGMSMGMGIGSAFGPMGAAIGAAAGAVGGALFGGILGAKRQQQMDMLKKSQDTFNKIIEGLNMGSLQLGDAIKQLSATRDQTMSQMQGTKKQTRSSYQSAIDQMNQQIQALKAQQAKIIKDMGEQLKVLSAPDAYQDWLTNLDAIIKKYDEFKGAAANANDLAKANQWLALSIKKYAAAQGKDLRDAQVTAINDAIQLNSLLDKRTEILQTEAKAEMDVMTQGNLIRQRTNAMTRMDQINQLRVQRDQQLKDIDDQINLAKYKVTAESKIFKLATDRVGLETQLLQLQKRNIDDDMLRIAALQNLVNALSSGSFNSMDSILQALGLVPKPTPAGGGGRRFPPGFGGGGGGDGHGRFGRGIASPGFTSTTGGSALEQMMSDAYLRSARMGAGGFRNIG